MRLHISILLVGILLHGAAGAEALDGLSPPTHQIQVLADTRIEDPPVFSGATSAPLPGPGERIELQVFIPAAAGKEAYGYIVEFDDADGAFSRAFTISDAYTWAVAQVYDQTGWRRIARRIDMPGPVGSAGPGRSILFANSPIVPASGLIATLVLDVNGTVARNRPLRFTIHRARASRRGPCCAPDGLHAELGESGSIWLAWAKSEIMAGGRKLGTDPIFPYFPNRPNEGGAGCGG